MVRTSAPRPAMPFPTRIKSSRPPNPVLGATATYSADQNLMGPKIGLFAGSGRTLASKWYVGGEINYSYGNQSGKSEIAISGPVNGSLGREIKVDHEGGIAARFGYMLSDTSLVYIQPGYQLAAIHWKDTGIGTSSYDDVIGGFRLSVGAEIFTTKHFSIRGDVSRTWYSTSASDEDGVNNKISVSENLVKLGVACYF